MSTIWDPPDAIAWETHEDLQYPNRDLNAAPLTTNRGGDGRGLWVGSLYGFYGGVPRGTTVLARQQELLTRYSVMPGDLARLQAATAQGGGLKGWGDTGDVTTRATFPTFGQ